MHLWTRKSTIHLGSDLDQHCDALGGGMYSLDALIELLASDIICNPEATKTEETASDNLRKRVKCEQYSSIWTSLG